MKILSTLNKTEVFIGMRVQNLVTNNTGAIDDVVINEQYREDDDEKNPIVTIKWDNGNWSVQPLTFMEKILVL